ncbi:MULTISPECIES: hypothetical protein [unclassified Burkholderia]|uniref:hypothetical protein n=1 Tax=unclassified Burkholderia TaxID=2613784 RepID=UPI002AB25A64|nr:MULTISPECIES: hypothetical protein [unclassified Burkholderia]
MYDKNDPRAGLQPGASAATEFAGAEYARFYDSPPQEQSAQMKAWIARGQNFVTVFIEADEGAILARESQPDEYVVLVPDATGAAQVQWDGKTSALPGASITFVPKGASEVTFSKPGRYLLLFSSQSEDMAAASVNAASYTNPHPNIQEWQPWPDPVNGWKVRSYSLDVPDKPGRFGRIWRCSTFMVNFLPAQLGPRDVTKLSPHSHDSFEQGSFALDGEFTHHIRWPWTPNLHKWRPDDHEFCAAPSLAVIPPPAIHTSRGMDQKVNQLIDIFAPPRVDFSLKDGWVLNATDYPMPKT